ncbi:MAG: M23 family metallopeptidase [candidate division KSB1 bacterium]|nr:M23 family metallopeptidase [candidate division KSB1 bacterium]MDZ7335657.1 M23 family metallopeptidase [candidate division KSB1 bacterium]MDZ7357724.1 M23 family metallopeptidase [candidate division KSB1 bacterium]MDZ7377444.1 M23 family metallopeptidase [candidate division KSB1 bacterium]MDZ7402034.1 M23 family metallopeptidase [candidate division KSB1 bacterium]
MNKRKREKQLSILIIPDDDSDPLTFRLSSNTVRILLGVAIVLVIHIFAGAAFYYKFAVTNRYSKRLERENINLKEDNRRINQMFDTVEELIDYNTRLRNALGVDQGFEISDRKKSQLMNTFRRSINMVPATEMSSEDVLSAGQNLPSKPRLNFITRTKKNYDQFATNIPNFLPVEGMVTTDFRRGDVKLPNHLGIDIAASRGTAVRAAADGIIIFANWTEALGNLIIIYHLNGYFTYYGHNQILLKKENTFVKKGEVIALVGSSGRSTAPHLHFEIWKDGIPVDPKEYLLTTQSKK